MQRLVIGHERHEVNAIEVLHALQPGETALVDKIIVGNENDLTHEGASAEPLANPFQQSLLMSLIQRRLAAGRNEREANA